ncbi:hypothetical protein SARC_14895 [Sphaeroforma arctica JP610]|uniref:Uncharacterized protein n=1 Tax=Sphaeroforma arctica JP610 TaxID=667725 RepID=A0A0L0F752_9EUKA|nr:hypothetical protein SARC_14895 [Sphaeroforma arctica JP610]KNC72545.1 hypothetical protein SARC_14895 [Sphaeroforma arctica JP610]|eukprot:XP_014146447.1 hypothetical protein SARC_14895 [Sphaeroforma arctica JP610]
MPIFNAHMRLMDLWKQDAATATWVNDREGVIWYGETASTFMRGFETPSKAWYGRFGIRVDEATWHLLALTNNPSGLGVPDAEPVPLADMFTSEVYGCNLEAAATACQWSDHRYKLALKELESSGTKFLAISERALPRARALAPDTPAGGCVGTQLWERVLALSTPSIGETPESLRAAFDTAAFVGVFARGRAARKTLDGTARRFLRHHYATVLMPSDIRYLTGNLARSIDTWVAGSVEYRADTSNVHAGVGALRDIQTVMTDYSTDLNLAVINMYMLRRILFNGVSKYTLSFVGESPYVARMKTGIALMAANGCLDHCLFQLRMVYPEITFRFVVQFMISDNPIVFEGMHVRAVHVTHDGHQLGQHRMYVLHRKGGFDRGSCTC